MMVIDVFSQTEGMVGMTNVEPWAVVGGNPARFIKKRVFSG